MLFDTARVWHGGCFGCSVLVNTDDCVNFESFLPCAATRHNIYSHHSITFAIYVQYLQYVVYEYDITIYVLWRCWKEHANRDLCTRPTTFRWNSSRCYSRRICKLCLILLRCFVWRPVSDGPVYIYCVAVRLVGWVVLKACFHDGWINKCAV